MTAQVRECSSNGQPEPRARWLRKTYRHKSFGRRPTSFRNGVLSTAVPSTTTSRSRSAKSMRELTNGRRGSMPASGESLMGDKKHTSSARRVCRVR
eukprot:6204599-Pleurochrysis_carterae.AAC.1